MATPSVPLQPLAPHQRRETPHQKHFYEFRKRHDRLRLALDTAAPAMGVPVAYNVPNISFDRAGDLWFEKIPTNHHGDGPYRLHRTHSKIKLIETSLEGSTSAVAAHFVGAAASTLQIPPRLTAIFNDPNITVYSLADLDHAGMLWTV